MKTTTVNIDGDEFKIAKFTVAQIEAMVKQGDTEDNGEIVSRMWNRIADSMSRANGRAYTVEEVKKLVDYDQFPELHNRIMDFNQKVKTGEPEGTDTGSISTGSAPDSAQI